jgi:hypothetical protein
LPGATAPPWHGGRIRLAQNQVSELPQLPVGVGGAKAFFDVEERGQLTWFRRRSRVEFLWVNRDPHAVTGAYHRANVPARPRWEPNARPSLRKGNQPAANYVFAMKVRHMRGYHQPSPF